MACARDCVICPFVNFWTRAAHFRISASDDSLEGITRLTLRELAARITFLDAQLKTAVTRLKRITEELAPNLIALHGVGPDTASTLLLTAGDNPERLRNERTVASLTGSCPVPASSGLVKKRYRLNRGGDRQANAALWRIALVRLSTDPTTREYVERRQSEGKTKVEPCAASSAPSPARSTTPYRKQRSVDSRSLT
jgi:transposase